MLFHFAACKFVKDYSFDSAQATKPYYSTNKSLFNKKLINLCYKLIDDTVCELCLLFREHHMVTILTC